MADIEAAGRVEESSHIQRSPKICLSFSIPFMQKIIAEIFGTYFVVFAGCGSVILYLSKGTITFPGVAAVWGLVVMVMVYSVPFYISAQMIGSTLASGTLIILFGTLGRRHYPGTVPQGSNAESFALEFIITFYLMFVISGVATDNRAVGELAGLAVGATVLLNVLLAGPISGASMNPARSLGPAIVGNRYEAIWVYVLAPVAGAIAGAWAYNLIRFTSRPLREIASSGSFLKSLGRRNSNPGNT